MSPTIVCGDPLHDQLALQRKVSAASPDASCLIADHKDILQRLSLKPRVAEDVPPVLSEPVLFLELEEVHHPLLKSVVEDLQDRIAAAQVIRNRFFLALFLLGQIWTDRTSL